MCLLVLYLRLLLDLGLPKVRISTPFFAPSVAAAAASTPSTSASSALGSDIPTNLHARSRSTFAMKSPFDRTTASTSSTGPEQDDSTLFSEKDDVDMRMAFTTSQQLHDIQNNVVGDMNTEVRALGQQFSAQGLTYPVGASSTAKEFTPFSDMNES